MAIRLVVLGVDVTLVDSLALEHGENLFNIDSVKDDVTINMSDVQDPFNIVYLVKEKDFNFNLAGQTSYLDSITMFPNTSVNTLGTRGTGSN